MSLHKYIWMCLSALILIQKVLSMASGSLKMRRLLARGAESLQLWCSCANLCFDWGLNGWQVCKVLDVELVKPAQLPGCGNAKLCYSWNMFIDFSVLCPQKQKGDCLHYLSCSQQTPQKSLGIALKFHNYTISEKNIKGCERGWWKINERM